MTVLPFNRVKSRTCVTLNGSGIQLAVGPQPLWLRNHNSRPAQRIMVKRLATSPHDPLGITDSACKNQSVMVSVLYGPFNPYIPIRSTTIRKSRVARDLIAMHTSWRSNSDIASVTRSLLSACYVAQRESAEGEQPAVVTKHNNVQQDPAGNPVVIDLTNMDQPQDRTTSAPAAGGEASKNQDHIQSDDAQPSTGQPSASNSQITSSSPAGQPVARNYQLVSPADQSVARDIQQASRLPAGQSATSASSPPADLISHCLISSRSVVQGERLAYQLINSVHVDFESILAMGEPGMVSMFQDLIASGLQGFLGCPAVVYEEALVEFFANGTVRDGLVVSTVNGVIVEISEKLFAETFYLPVDGLEDVSEMPKDKIFDARSIVSLTGEPVTLSGSKSQMKMHHRLLCDIMAKSISVKAGSFNAITVEKFSLLTAVVCDVKMNWGSVLFGIFKKMVTPGTKQAKGFSIQISLLLESVPNLELVESSEFPSSKILTDKTIHRYIAVIDKSGAQEPADAPKKRTSKKKSNLEMVAVAHEIVPLQMVEPCPVAPAVAEHVELPAAEEGISAAQSVEVSIGEAATEIDASADRDKLADTNEERHWFDLTHEELIAKWAAEQIITSPADTNDEIEDDKPVFNDPDTIINQVLQYLDSISADKNVEPDEEAATMDVDTAGEDQQVQEPVAQNTNDDLLDDDEQKSLEDILLTIPVDVPLPSTGMEITKIVMGKEIKIPEVTERTWFLNSLPKIPADNKGKAILVEKDPIKGNPTQEHYFLICADIDLPVALRANNGFQKCTDFSEYSLSCSACTVIFSSGPVFFFFCRPSSSLNFDATDLDAPVSSLPTVSIDFSAALADFQAILLAQIDESQSVISSRLHKIEQSLCDSLRDQADIFKNLSQGARQEARTIDDVQTLRFNDFRKNVLAQNASIFTGLVDVRKEVQEVDILASRLNDVQKNVEETKEALSHQLLEFQREHLSIDKWHFSRQYIRWNSAVGVFVGNQQMKNQQKHSLEKSAGRILEEISSCLECVIGECKTTALR
ncbi:dystroglycan-like [Dorcoceras hygrometricum]|uniref:Dystroglycan-like n=1 Tax=Dorcoceras hygrometricum TaxID=472368 RepID=A0A2Z7B7K8_9LAMI|nr:dystroglycan-like [Dorcoceras hygrometricum]